jgi:hypothetical protein
METTMKKLCIILFALAFALNCYAADVKISDLTEVTSPTTSTAVLPVVDAGATKKVTIDNILKRGSLTQAYDAELTAIAGLTSAANTIPYFTGSGTAGLIASSANMVSLLESADYAAARTNLGLAIGTNIQAYNADLATLAVGGSANCLWGEKSDSSGIECKSTISVVIDDSAAQFKSATASKGTRKLVQSSIDNGILLTDTPVITGNVTWTNISQGAGTYTRVFEEALNVFTVKQEFDATAGLQVGSTGVLITSDNDGAITFLGASGGYDEDLTLNLDDTENTAVVSSSTGVTKLSSAAIAWSGPVIAPEVLIDCAGSADPYAYCTSANASTLTAPQVNRTIINSYGRAEAQTVTLPTAAAGMTFIVIVGTQHNSKFEIAKGASDLYLEVSGAPHGVAAFSETNEVVGSRASCATFQTGAATWSWICGGISGTWDHTDL